MNADLIKVGPRFRKDLGAIDGLAESIKAVGLIHPIVVDAEGNLIAGERRLAACRLLGMRDIPVSIVNLDDDARLRVEHDENAVRKDFTPTEARAIRDARLAREREKAKERMLAGKPSPKLEQGEAKARASRGTGYGKTTLDKVKVVEEAAAADPALVPIVEEMDRTGKVDPAYRAVVAPRPVTEEQRAASRKAASEEERAEKNAVIRELWYQDEDANREVRDTLVGLFEKHGDLLALWEEHLGVFWDIEFGLEKLADALEEAERSVGHRG